MKLIYYINIAFVIFSCSGKSKKENFIIESIGKEWRLDKRNDKDLVYTPNRLYLVFHKDNTYDLYRKHEGKRRKDPTDNIIEQKWFFDENGNLYIADFSSSEYNTVLLDSKNLIFTFGIEKYAFVCDECK